MDEKRCKDSPAKINMRHGSDFYAIPAIIVFRGANETVGITDNLRIQHKELLEIITEMSSCLSPDQLAKDAAYVHGMLLNMSATLKFHLTREDQALYPALCRHPDKKISVLAKKYLDEMGGINDAFEQYAARWPHAMAIQENPEGFIKESREIFAALSRRIDREDNGLYPLLDVV